MFPTASRPRVLSILSPARALTAACAVGFSLLPNVPAAAGAPPSTDPVSRLSVGLRQGDADSGEPSMTSDGRYLAFSSRAGNLVENDGNGQSDVFRVDLESGECVRISINSSATEGNAASFSPAISADGNRIAFASRADNLVSGDNNNAIDVFVHDVSSGETTRVSTSALGVEGDGMSHEPSISADGLRVVFRSLATNLMPGDTNQVADVFVLDLPLRSLSRASVSPNGGEGDGSSGEPALSADGSYVAFTSESSNLVTGDNNGSPDIFRRDLDAGRTVRVSVSSAGLEGFGWQTGSPSISADGRLVAFQSDSGELLGRGYLDLSHIFVHDAQTGVTSWLSTNRRGAVGDGDHLNPVLSDDGRFVVYSSDTNDLVGGRSTDYRQAYRHDRLTADTVRVSVHRLGEAGDDESGIYTNGLALSGDGTLVAFESYASDLVTNDANGAKDIIVRDMQAGQNRLASVTTLPADPSGSSEFASLSRDRRFVAFTSRADNLVSIDDNGKRDVFVLDRQSGRTTLVSVSSQGVQANDDAGAPSISADGRYVAFDSYASNLVPGDLNGLSDVFLHDRTTGETRRISVDSTGIEALDMSFNPSLSADGRFVAFASYANNLVPGDTNMVRDVFVRDTVLGETTRVSVSSAGVEADDDSGEYRWDTDGRWISADGRFVTFPSNAGNLVAGDNNMYKDIFVHDRQTGQTVRASVSSSGQEGDKECLNTSISANGRVVSFTSDAGNLVPGDSNQVTDIFAHDLDSGETSRVSVDSTGLESNGGSGGTLGAGSLSSDGRYVAFESTGDNLVPGDNNAKSDVFVHDRQSAETKRISVDASGAEANGPSTVPTLSADNCVVLFTSAASNLIFGDNGLEDDLFLAVLGTAAAPTRPVPPSAPSAPPAPQFVRGDADTSGTVDMADLVEVIRFVYLPGTTLACDDAADANDDGQVELSDAIFLLYFLGTGAPIPSSPYPAAGVDPTADALGCTATP